MDKIVDISLFKKDTKEVLMVSNSLISDTYKNDKKRLPKTLELDNTEDNAELYSVLSKLQSGEKYRLELDGIDFGNYFIQHGENKIILKEVMKIIE